MGRIFIMRANGFPQGGPGSNYVQNLAYALKIQQWEVIVNGIGENRKTDYLLGLNKYLYGEIEYYNYMPKNQFEKSFYYSQKFAKDLINRYQFSVKDYVIFFTPDYFYTRILHRFIPYEHMLACRVEQGCPHQFHLGVFNPRYLVYRMGIRYHYLKIKKTLPISSYIQLIDEKYGCKTLRLPPLADPFKNDYHPRKTKSDIIKMIYPGLKQTDFEDDIPLALKALEKLPSGVLPSIEFHITGISKEKFFEKYNMDGVLDRLGPLLRIHGWLQYDQLVNLYQKMDFVLLCRKENKITIANFPSKIPELMCYGVIPVCTRVGDYTKYYLEDGYNSILFNSGSVEACSKAINEAINLSSSKYNAMSMAARRMTENEFSYQNWAKKLHEFILA